MANNETVTSGRVLQHIQTTKNLLPHIMLSRLRICQRSKLAYGIASSLLIVAFTFVPLLISALIELPSVIEKYSHVTLPFLLDGNILFMFLASLPILVGFSVTDEFVLRHAVTSIQKDHIISITRDDAKYIVKSSIKWFSFVNIFAQVLGAVVGITVAVSNYVIYSNPKIGYWVLLGNKFSITGYVYLYCIFIFYCTICIALIRAIAINHFLRRLVKKSSITLEPFHPDRCGGLQPIGQLALRSQYILSVLGVNLVLLYLIYPVNLSFEHVIGLKVLLATAAVAYILLTPLYFVLPLLPFRYAMKQEKHNWMREVSQRLTKNLENVRSKVSDGIITKDDEEILDRLRKLFSIFNEFPVWPFDATTLKKFITAYIAPIATSAVIKFVPTVISTLISTK